MNEGRRIRERAVTEIAQGLMISTTETGNSLILPYLRSGQTRSTELTTVWPNAHPY